jgi:hypothetical protein
MQRLHVAAAALAMALVSMPTHAEIQKWQVIATVDRVDSGFEPPAFLQLGSKVKVVYTVDVDAPLSGNMFSALPRIRFDKDGTATDGGYVLALSGLTALNTAFKKPRADGVDFVSYNCFDSKLAATVSEALAICASRVNGGSEVRFDVGPHSVWASPKSFRMMAND